MRLVGDHSVRTEVRAGDTWAGDTATKNRAELRHDANLPFDTDLWISFGLRVSGALGKDWLVVGQFHDEHDDGEGYKYPPLAFEYNGTHFTVVTRSDPTPLSTVEDTGGIVRFSEPGLRLDVWQQFVFRFRFARTGNGYLQVWRDGAEIVPGAAIPMGFNDVLGHYWKFGAYRKAETTPLVVDYSHMEIGTTDLSTRIANPLPIPAEFG